MGRGEGNGATFKHGTALLHTPRDLVGDFQSLAGQVHDLHVNHTIAYYNVHMKDTSLPPFRQGLNMNNPYFSSSFFSNPIFTTYLLEHSYESVSVVLLHEQSSLTV